jgi:pseudoazurin
MNKKTLLATAIAGALTASAMFAVPAFAEDYTVQMLNRGSDGQMMVFEPAYLNIQPGDAVTFVATDPGHNAETIPGMSPEGASSFRGPMGQDVTATFDAEGLYGIKCLPHYGLGMVALIKVGDGTPPNLEAAEDIHHPGRAAQSMDALLEEAQAGE